MPVVPYKQQVQQDVVRIPDVQDANGAQSVRQVVGAIKEVSNASEGLGQSVSKIGDVLQQHALKQIELNNDQAVASAYTNYAKQVQDWQFNPTPETVKVNGQDVTRPTGFMARQLGQTQGALQELDAKYYANRSSYLDAIPNSAYKQKLATMMDTHFDTVRGSVASHEAKQLNDNNFNINKSAVDQQVADAYGAQTPDALAVAVSNATTSQHSLNQAAGYDDVTSGLTVQKTTKNVTENSVIGKLMATGSTADAYSLLDTVKDKLSPENYDELKTKIAKAGDNIEKQYKDNQDKQIIASRLDNVDKLANGHLNWTNSSQQIQKVAATDKDLAEAMQAVVNQGNDYKPEDANNDAFADVTKKVFSAGTQKELSDYMVQALNVRGNGQISRDRLAILVNAAQQRAKSLPPTNSDGSPLPPTQIAIDGGMQAVQRWNTSHGNKDPETLDNYMKSITDGKQPKEAYDLATKATINKQFPETATLEDVPHMIVSKGSPTKYIFTGKSNIYPARMYNPSTKKFEVNINREQVAK